MGVAQTPDDGGPAGTRNQLSHVTGPVVQAGNIHGGAHFYSGAPARPAPVPQQVPPLSTRFVNRDAEFAVVDGVLDAAGGPAARIVLIPGLPGVGKSTFVRSIAERKRAVYSGGQLYVDFTRSPGRPGAAVGDALTACLGALGVTADVMPAGVVEQTKLYRTLTAALPTLVVLDDVSEPAQVLAFVPNAPGSAVLVTSNDQLSELLLDGAEPVPLEPLDAASGARLVAELGGRRVADDPDAVAELVRLCGGLPVALQVAAARLRTRPSLGVARLVAEIADESRGLSAFTLRGESRMAAVFAASYQDLPPEVALMYRRLGLVPAPDFTADLAAVAADVEPDVAEALLDRLVEVSLLGVDGAGRFRFHNLVRRHARDQAVAVDPERERIGALRRVVDHVVARAAWADLAALGPGRLRCTPHDTLLAGRDDPFAHADGRERKRRGLDWLDATRPTALALVRVAVEQGWFDAAWQLSESMTALFVVRRYLADWTELTEWGVRAARGAGHAAAEARLRSFVSRAWTDLGDAARAGRELDAALAIAKPLGRPRLLASIWELVGRYRDHLREHGAAGAGYRRALALFSSVEDRRGVAFVTFFLGVSQLDHGETGTALDTLREARELIRAVDDDRMAGRALTAAGIALDRLGRDDEARAAFGEAIVLLAAGGYDYYEAAADEALAEFAAARGDATTAETGLRRAIAIHQDLGGPRVAELRARLDALSGRGPSTGSAGSGDPPGA